jgi:hypothetical protein
MRINENPKIRFKRYVFPQYLLDPESLSNSKTLDFYLGRVRLESLPGHRL